MTEYRKLVLYFWTVSLLLCLAVYGLTHDLTKRAADRWYHEHPILDYMTIVPPSGACWWKDGRVWCTEDWKAAPCVEGLKGQKP